MSNLGHKPKQDRYEEIKRRIEENDDFTLLTTEEEYINNKTKLKIHSRFSNLVFTKTFDNFDRVSKRMLVSKKNKKIIIEQMDDYLKSREFELNECRFKESVKEIHGDNIEILNNFIDTKTILSVKHIPCGSIYKISYRDLINRKKHKCPICTHKDKVKNRTNDRLVTNVDFLEYISANFKQSKINYKDNYKLDCLIRSHNLGIMYKSINNDAVEYFNKRGIRILSFFHDEWVKHQDLVISKIEDTIKPKELPDNLYVKEIFDDTEFMNKYSLFENIKPTMKLGLYSSNELIVVMYLTATKKKCEISRLISKHVYSKTYMKYFIEYIRENCTTDKLIYYSNLRFESKYSANLLNGGFNTVKTTKPKYYYIEPVTGVRHEPHKFRRNLLDKYFNEKFDKDLTEQQIMNEKGYTIVYDCGRMVYEYILNKK